MAWLGEKLIIRMWETLSEKGVGSLLRPWQIKRDGIAQIELRRAEMLALAQTEMDVDLIRTGQKKLGDFSPELNFASTPLAASVTKARTEPVIDLPTVIQVVTQQNIEDSVRRHINVSHAICFAEEALRNDPQDPPSNKIDDDWLFRWRDYAGDVSSESMQSLWGRVLAGEVKSPGSFSLRTLEFMRNLSQEEAKSIEHLLQFVVGGIIWRDDSLDASFESLMTMQDLGVISGVEALGLETRWTSGSQAKFEKALPSHKKVIVIRHDDPKKEFTLPVYLLTVIGKQLLQLGMFSANVTYLERVAMDIHKQGFSVTLADIIETNGSMIRFSNERPIQNQQDIQTESSTSKTVL